MIRFRTLLLLLAFFLIIKTGISQGIYVPSGYGAWGGALYTGISLTMPDTYRNSPDGVAGVGFGVGNPVKNLGFQVSGMVLNPKERDRFSFGAKVHKYIGNGFSAAVGLENVLAKTYGGGSNSPSSQYISLSQNFAYVYPSSEFLSRVMYTVGGGFGRFSIMSPRDSAEGHGWKGISALMSQDRKYGTYIFGAVQLKITKNIHYIVEWSGINLNTGISLNAKMGNIPVKLTLGAADLTKFTGSGARFVSSFAIGINTYKKPEVKQPEVKKKENDIQRYEELLTINQIETLNKIDRIIQDRMKGMTLMSMDSAERAKLFQGMANNNNQQNQDNINDPNNPNRLNQQNNNQNQLNNNQNPQNQNKPVKDYEQVKILSNENINEYNYQSNSLGKRINQGIYLVLYSFKTRQYGERAIEALKGNGINASLCFNQSRDWYYVYTHIFKLNELQLAITKCNEYRGKGYEGAWLIYYN